MTRIGDRLARRKQEGRPAFVAFLTAGDPSLDATVAAALALEAAGADVLELGVPFSDPLADGPVIQRSSERALARGVTLERVLETVVRIREKSELPLVLFSYLNPLLQRGLARALGEAKSAGVDGVLVTDLPPEEAGEWIPAARKAGVDTIFLASPTSPDERLRRVAEASRGFVYAISRTGVTGERQALSDEARPLVERLRALTDVPVALGFGISTPEQVKEVSAVGRRRRGRERPGALPGGAPGRRPRGSGEMADERDVTGEAQVGDLRLRIDQIDDQLMKLLNSRSACAVEIGRIKRRFGMALYQPDREKWILDRVERNNPGPLDSGALRRVFERVIDESRRLERLAGEAEARAKNETK